MSEVESRPNLDGIEVNSSSLTFRPRGNRLTFSSLHNCLHIQKLTKLLIAGGGDMAQELKSLHCFFSEDQGSVPSTYRVYWITGVPENQEHPFELLGSQAYRACVSI